MADDEMIDQDEVERLLQQAQSGAAPQPPATEPETPAKGDEQALDQAEIEALINKAPTTAESSPPPQPPAAATAASPSAAGAPAATVAPAPGPPVDSSTASQSDVEVLLSKAQEAIASIDEPSGELPPGVSPFQLSDFSGTPPNREAATLELVRDVQLDLRIELGRTRMQLEDVLKLRQGAVVPLDKLAGDPVDVFVNDRLVARGEVLVLNDNFCVRVTELVAGEAAVA